MSIEAYKKTIAEGKAVLGLELGSTRIKAVLIGEDHTPIASGSADWENKLENGIWTYSLDEVWAGVRLSFENLKKDVANTYGITLKNLKAMGISGMMHGYLPFDKEDNLLVPFRTWRNTITEEATKILSPLFGFNVPQRWSIAHLYQAILSKEEHVDKIARLTTIAGYLHWKLTDKFVMGVGEASGMFPIDPVTGNYDQTMLTAFAGLMEKENLPWTLTELLPTVLSAGEAAGELSAEGATLLDPAGDLVPGIPFCPPEGDAGTGMVATNSVTPFTGNVSAGTSIFSMVVLDKSLKNYYPEIDMVATPAGHPVAMVHCNNCTSDINAWAQVLMDFAARIGMPISRPQALDALFFAANDADPDCGGVINYNFFSGEHIVGLTEGRPMLVRGENANFNFANFARSALYSATATLRIGMDILMEKEQVRVDSLLGHGGFFKATGVGQKVLASALNTPISVMQTAGEGGPWGMALLAAYMANKEDGESLEAYLANKVFAAAESSTVAPDPAMHEGFNTYLSRYKAGLPAEQAAVDTL
ncbi:MAG: ATPase [Clostridia bacterium]|nr:ATPase [Clostridia bacterium]